MLSWCLLLATAVPALPTGLFSSRDPELVANGAGVRRTLSLEQGRFVLESAVGTADLRTIWVEARLEGTITATSDSRAVPGAREVTLRFSKKSIRRRTADFGVIQRLDLSRCGLEVDRWVDITHVGCSWIFPVEAHAQDYDLLALEGELLRLGARPPDGMLEKPARRPKMLGPPLVRVVREKKKSP